MIELIPFGKVLEDRVELSKKYKLIEMIAGIWRLTKKCKDNYTSLSYLLYLKGEVEEPERLNPKPVKVSVSNKTKKQPKDLKTSDLFYSKPKDGKQQQVNALLQL